MDIIQKNNKKIPLTSDLRQLAGGLFVARLQINTIFGNTGFYQAVPE